MASLGDVGTSSFDAYEGIRIFIPGAILYTTGSLALHTVLPEAFKQLQGEAILTVIAALILGLILYYWDLPARAAACVQNQPTDWLEKNYPNVKRSDLLTAYFEILNTIMPAAIRNRALYMGSMYRIGLELILSLSVSASVVFGISLLRGDDAVMLGDRRRVTAAVVILGAFVVSCMISAAYERKVSFRVGRPRGNLLVRSLRNLGRRSMFLYLAGLLLILWPHVCPPVLGVGKYSPVLMLCGYTTCLVYWALRYVRGDALNGSDPRKRQPLESPAAAALLLTPILASLCLTSGTTRDPLDHGGDLLGWTAAMCLTVLSIVIRGHERKLHGSYAGQRRWLMQNCARYEHVIDPALGKPVVKEAPPDAQSANLPRSRGLGSRLFGRRRNSGLD